MGGIKHGVRLGYESLLRVSGRPSARNLPTDQCGQEHMRKDIAERKLRGAMQRLADRAPFPGALVLVASPIGTLPKQNSKLRIIHHLLWPRQSTRNTSVNSGIDPALVSLWYKGLCGLFDNVQRAVRKGRPMEIWKVNLEDAFCHVVRGRLDHRLLGYSLDREDYVDCPLTFGGRLSPFLFNLYAEVFHWIMALLGIRLNHYLDNLFGSAPLGNAPGVIQVIRGIAGHLGLRVLPTKVEHGRTIEVLGVLVDAENGTATITEKRHGKVLAEIAPILASGLATRFELKHLIGVIMFMCQVVPHGVAFMRRMYNAVRKLGDAKRRVWGSALTELDWWRGTLTEWDGVYLVRTARGMGYHS